MTTRSEFSAELAALRLKLAEEPAPPPPDPAPDRDPDRSDLLSLLGGIEGAEALWDRVNAELDGWPRDKPLLSALAAFGIGYLLGRASQSGG